MARFVELRRHTDNDGDVLTTDGVAAALRLGAGLGGGDGVVVEAGLRSEREDRWRAVAKEADGGDLGRMLAADPAFVDQEAAALGAALGRVLERLGDGERALVVGHSPTNEAAVLGLTGELVAPLDKGAGILVTEDGGSYRVETLEP